jgi:negative regulator of sigma E activity
LITEVIRHAECRSLYKQDNRWQTWDSYKTLGSVMHLSEQDVCSDFRKGNNEVFFIFFDW